MHLLVDSFLKYLFIFRERGKEGEERERNISRFSLEHPNPGMCPLWESNPQPFGSQASTQSTEPHQPGLIG